MIRIEICITRLGRSGARTREIVWAAVEDWRGGRAGYNIAVVVEAVRVVVAVGTVEAGSSSPGDIIGHV